MFLVQIEEQETPGPNSHVLMTGERRGGGGGVRVIFWGLKFWPKVIFLGL